MFCTEPIKLARLAEWKIQSRLTDQSERRDARPFDLSRDQSQKSTGAQNATVLSKVQLKSEKGKQLDLAGLHTKKTTAEILSVQVPMAATVEAGSLLHVQWKRLASKPMALGAIALIPLLLSYIW